MEEEQSSPINTTIPLSQQAMVARDLSYLDALNPQQRAAAEQIDGPVLILAGAGTGKTKTLTTRVAHVLNMGLASPKGILAVTFTNKAAREMKKRISDLIGQIEGLMWMGTFHSICVKMLRRDSELVGLKSNFTILDTDDQLRLMKQLIQAHKIDEKRWPPRHLAAVIEGWKNRAWTPAQVPSEQVGKFNGKGLALYKEYQERLRILNVVDFGDLLMHMVTIFQKHSDVLEKYQRWFRYILVDEYQDTNVAQYLWLRLLAGKHQNICCVGDDDQSIYGWRGAEVDNILRFEKDFPGAFVVRLEQNYRSTPHILAAASAVISANETRLGKTLWTDKNEGEKLRLIGHWDGEAEARWIGDEIEAFQSGMRSNAPRSLEEMAILVRASHQMRAFEDRFMNIGLPYRVIGGPRFYERLEIRDAMAYFRMAVSGADDLAFERIFNKPKRGLGSKAMQTVQMIARENGVSLFEGARRAVFERKIGGKGAKELAVLVAQIERWQKVTQEEIYAHIELAEVILDESGYTEMWQNTRTPDAEGRLENLKELVKALNNFENLQGFLEHVSLVMENETEGDGEKLSIMTLHAAKGLEFPVVFLPGWEEGIFPSQRAVDEVGKKGEEEERRLAYVGITRAEELCTISFAANRNYFGRWQTQMPSRFVDELPADHVDVLTGAGLYGGRPNAAMQQGIHNAPQSNLETRASTADVYNSPGWRRLQERTMRGFDPQSAPVMAASKGEIFGVGDRVFHQKFGYGEVVQIESDKLEIEFDKAGSKKIMSAYVSKATQANDIPF